MSDWQPIQTVRKDVDVLVTNGKFVAQASCETGSAGDYWEIFGYRWPAPFDKLGLTHWMPLPEPPNV